MPTSHMKYLLSVFIFLFSLSSFSQVKKKPEKLSKKQFVQDSIKIMRMKRIRPQLRVENRMTYHKGQFLNLNGIDAGVLLKDKLRITLGYYYLNEDLSAYKVSVDGEDVTKTIRLQYGSINTEFVYMNTRFVSLGMPLDFGFGRNELQFRNLITNETYGKESGFVFLTDFGLSAVVKPIRAVGIRGVVGYRKILINPVKNFNFNGVFTSVGISVDIFEIIKDVRMYNLKKKYKRGDPLGNAVDLITD